MPQGDGIVLVFNPMPVKGKKDDSERASGVRPGEQHPRRGSWRTVAPEWSREKRRELGGFPRPPTCLSGATTGRSENMTATCVGCTWACSGIGLWAGLWLPA